MQPFAQSPLDTKERPKNPHEGRRKKARYGSMRKQCRNDSSDDERKESDSPDDSSGTEVKGDSDFMPTDQD